MPREDRDRDWNYTASSQGVWEPLDIRRNKKTFFSRVFKGVLRIYIKFQPPGYDKNTVYCFKSLGLW